MIQTVLAAVLAVGTVGAVTKHFSFRNGYPTTTTRQTGASFGASGATQGGGTKKTGEKTLVGTVMRIDAGDQIGVTPTGGRCVRVRLLRADAPEQGQPFGVEAKKFLFDLVNGKKVTVLYYTKDRSGTIEGTVFLKHEKGQVDVNLTLIKNGLAWYAEPQLPEGCRKDTATEKTYVAAETDAKQGKRGLWAAPLPVRPSEWRKLRK